MPPFIILRPKVHKDIAAAARRLGLPAPTPASVHAARKALKRGRAGLRLMRNAIGDTFYVKQNARLRDAASPLGRLRDGHVLRQTIAKLERAVRNPACEQLLADLKRRIEKDERGLDSADFEADLAKSAKMIRAAADDIRDRPLENNLDKYVIAGVARIYRTARKSFKRAAINPTDDQLHEARKQTKYFHHALLYLSACHQKNLSKFLKRSKSLGDRLGDDHDLALLKQAIIASPQADRAKLFSLFSYVDVERGKLQKQAFRAGESLYASRVRILKNQIRHNLKSSDN